MIENIRGRKRQIDFAYYMTYAVLFFGALIGTTEFMQWPYVTQLRNFIYMGTTALMLILWLLGLVLQEDIRVNIAKIAILGVGIAQFIFGGGSSLILILTILIGATDRKSARVILQESLVIGIIVMIVTYLAAMNGWIQHHVTWDGRHAFGFIYYSHFSDKLLYLYMIYRCLRRKRESILGYILAFAMLYLDYRYTHARTVTICLLIFLLLCIGYDLWKGRLGEKWQPATRFMGILSSGAYIEATLLTFGGIAIYRILSAMDGLEIPVFLQSFMARLFFNSRAFEEYGITLLGQSVFEVSNPTGGENIISDWFFLDNAFMRLFIITGVMTLFFFVAYMTAWMLKTVQKKQFFLWAALLVAAIGGLSEAYTINFYYNVFAILAFASLEDIQG